MASDAEIIEAVLRGQIERYAELVARYESQAWKVAISLVGNLEEAKEISQDSFVKAYLHLRRFRWEANFSTWLFRIVVNECKDFFKRRARQGGFVSLTGDPEEDPVLFDVADSSKDPGDALVHKELALQLSQAIEALPERQRVAFTLHHLHGLQLQEV